MMPKKKVTDPRPHGPGTRARDQIQLDRFHASRLNWSYVGEDLVRFSALIIERFAELRGIDPDLYSTERLVKRSSWTIDKLVGPNGWRNLCYSIDDEGRIKKKSYWNRDRLRAACSTGKVPYWRDMHGHEMRAILLRWAIEEKVAEFK